MTELPAAIRLILPYPEGGGSDQRARLVARHLGRQLDRPVTVVNITGAVKGHEALAQAAADGATIGQITGEVGMMHWHRQLTAVTPESYTALAAPFVESAAIIVKADAPFADLGAFIERCRAGEITGSGGPDFSVWKFALIGLLHAAGLPIERVRYLETYSGEQGLQNVLDGKALVAPITMTDARGPLRAGEARALATMEDQRHPAFPDVPTVQEAIGIRWSVAHWRGVVAPRGLPAGLRARYLEAFDAIRRDADFIRECAGSSFTLRWRLGDEFADYMREDDAQFGRLIEMLDARDGSSAGLF